MKGYLIRPRDWQLIAQREAAALLGTPEGAAKLAEAKRYEVLADKIDRLEAAVQLCDKHKPNGGTRSCCVICSGEALSAALSQISYLCSEPNEMGVSPYDAHFDEEAVVDQVRHALKDLAPEREGQPRMYTATGPVPEAGHWYSPATVREMLAAERERCIEAVEGNFDGSSYALPERIAAMIVARIRGA